MRPEFGYFEETKLGKPYDVKLIRRLYPFSRPYRFFLLISILLVSFITVLELAVPYVTKIAIDRFIVPRESTVGMATDGAVPENKVRYYQVRLDAEGVRDVVTRYPRLFSVEDGRAQVRFDDLEHMEKEDLNVLRRSDLAGVGWAALVLLLLVLLSFGLNFIQVIFMEYTGQMMMHDLRVKLFDHLQLQSVGFFTRHPVGRLVTRVTNDIQNMHELFTSVVVVVFKDLFLLAGIALVLLGVDWQLALLCFTVIPFVLYASFKFADLARDAFRELRIKIAEINTRFSETIGGIEVIQLFRQASANLRIFKATNHANYLAGMRQIEIFAVFMPLIELLGAVAIAVVIYYGGRGVLQNTLTLGALVAFISYMKMFFRPIRDIAEKYNVMQNAMASAERIFLLMDTDERLPQTVPTGRPISDPAALNIQEIAFERVSFEYMPDEPVLENISLRVRAGESVAVVGPTGAGKTTLIHLLMRFYDPTAGRVTINGRDLRQIDQEFLRSKIALVTQEPFLFSESVRDNILRGNQELGEDAVQRLLTAANCRELVEKLPAGLDTVLSEGGSSISSGERQLLSIARAFARTPELIILDEATSYIDSDTEQKVQTALSNLMHRRTAFIVAHRLSTARSADRIMVLHRGRIIEHGSHDALMQLKGFYYKLNLLQNHA